MLLMLYLKSHHRIQDHLDFLQCYLLGILQFDIYIYDLFWTDFCEWYKVYESIHFFFFCMWIFSIIYWKKFMLLDRLRDIENKLLDTMGKGRGEGQDQGMGWRHTIYYKANR